MKGVNATSKDAHMPATKTVRRSVAMTPAMRARLQQLLDREPRHITEAALIRQAIREYLDRQEDVVSSRAHFRKTFQARIDTLDAGLTLRLDALLALLAHGLALLLPAFTEQPVSAADLVQAAIVAAAQDAQTIQNHIDAVRGT
jgi:predicted DNA-binding protein